MQVRWLPNRNCAAHARCRLASGDETAASRRQLEARWRSVRCCMSRAGVACGCLLCNESVVLSCADDMPRSKILRREQELSNSEKLRNWVWGWPSPRPRCRFAYGPTCVSPGLAIGRRRGVGNCPPALTQGEGGSNVDTGDTASAVPRGCMVLVIPRLLFASLPAVHPVLGNADVYYPHLLHATFEVAQTLWDKRGKYAPLRRAGGRRRGGALPRVPLATPHTPEASAIRAILPATVLPPELPGTVDIPPQRPIAKAGQVLPPLSVSLEMSADSSALPLLDQTVTLVTAFTPFLGPRSCLFGHEGGNRAPRPPSLPTHEHGGTMAPRGRGRMLQETLEAEIRRHRGVPIPGSGDPFGRVVETNLPHPCCCCCCCCQRSGRLTRLP